MRTRIWLTITALLLSVCWAAPVASQGRGDVLKELVPPPRMLLRHQEDLGLAEKQKKQLKKVIKDAQTASLDLEFKVQEEAEKLAKIIEKDKFDVKKALAQADKLMAAETALKRVRLEMMLRTKTLLTAGQLKKINEFRKKQREERRERRKRGRANE